MNYKNKTLSIDIIYDIISDIDKKAMEQYNYAVNKVSKANAKNWLLRPDKFFFIDKWIAYDNKKTFIEKIDFVHSMATNLLYYTKPTVPELVKPYNNNKYTSLASFVEDNRDYAMSVTCCSCKDVAEMKDKLDDMGVCVSSLTGYVYLP